MVVRRELTMPPGCGRNIQMSTCAVNDTTHTVHRPGVLRSMSSLELKEHLDDALPNSMVVMGQFRPRSMSTSTIEDMAGSVEQMPDPMTPAAAMRPDKVAAGL